MVTQTAQTTETAQPAEELVAIPRRRFTVAEYYRMAEAGILAPDERVELIDGEIVVMSPVGSPHAARVTRAMNLFTPRLHGRAVVSAQNPVRLDDDYWEPEPDVMLLRPRPDFYAGGHPGPQDVWLLIEVADTSLAYDRRVKLPKYARAGIREVWLEDLPGGAIEVYRQPSPEGYREVRRVQRGQRLSPEAFPDVEVAVEELLG